MKKVLSVIVVLCMIMSVIPVTISAATSGTCGENLTWAFDNGTLTISGSGIMDDYFPFFGLGDLPWDKLINEINHIVIEQGVTGIGNYAFSYCSNVVDIVIPGSLSSIGNLAFLYCNSLSKVYIEDIDAWCRMSLYDSSNPLMEGAKLYLDGDLVTEVAFPQDITEVPYYIFEGYKFLESVKLGENITTINAEAFHDCTALTDVYYAGTADDWNNIEIGENNDYLLNATTHYNYVSEESTEFASGTCGDNLTWAFSDGTLTISGNGEMESYEVNKKPWSNFNNDIEAVVIENGVTSVGNYAFEFLYELKTVEIGNDVETIGSCAFWWDEAIEYISLPDSVKVIEEYAFEGCTAMMEISMYNAVVTIGDCAFDYCSSIEKVIFYGDETQWSEIEIGSGNDHLLNAELCFTGYSANVPKIEYVVNGNDLVVKGENITEDILIFLTTNVKSVVYKQRIDLTDGEERISMDENSEETKILIWESLESMKPLCEAITVTK